MKSLLSHIDDFNTQYAPYMCDLAEEADDLSGVLGLDSFHVRGGKFVPGDSSLELVMTVEDMEEDYLSDVVIQEECLNEESPPDEKLKKWLEDPKVQASFKSQYGDEWKEVMFARAWALYNKKEKSANEQTEHLSESLSGAVILGAKLALVIYAIGEIYTNANSFNANKKGLFARAVESVKAKSLLKKLQQDENISKFLSDKSNFDDKGALKKQKASDFRQLVRKTVSISEYGLFERLVKELVSAAKKDEQ